MEYVYNKLVRDKIPEIIRKDNQVPVTRILPEEEYQVELERKMLEEQKELMEARGADRIEELADLLELIRADAELNSSSLEEVTRVADKKKAKRGGFSQRIYLEKVIDK